MAMLPTDEPSKRKGSGSAPDDAGKGGLQGVACYAVPAALFNSFVEYGISDIVASVMNR